MTVDITHPSRGDLSLELWKDNRPVKTLVENVGGTTDNIKETYTLTGAEIGSDINGVWMLYVWDQNLGDTGTLNKVTLSFAPADDLLVESSTPLAGGEYASVEVFECKTRSALSNASNPNGPSTWRIPSYRLDPASNYRITMTRRSNFEPFGSTYTFGETSLGRMFDKEPTAGYALTIDNWKVTSGLTFFSGCTTGNLLAAWSVSNIANILGTWHHIVVNYDSTSTANAPTIFLDGAPVSAVQLSLCGGATVSDANADLDIGNNASSGTRGFDGRLDEMGVASVTRSPEWVLTQYRNHNDPTLFYTVSNPL